MCCRRSTLLGLPATRRRKISDLARCTEVRAIDCRSEPKLSNTVPTRRQGSRKAVEEEIRKGLLDRTEKQNRISALKREESREILKFIAEEESTKRIKVRGEPDVIEALLSPETTPRKIRDLCREAFMTIDMPLGSDSQEVEVPAWPITAGSVLPRYLSEHAEAFIEARRDPRFPRCEFSRRPSTLWKQLWFLSRALAGAVFGIRTRTALNLVGATRPDNPFRFSRYGKTKRKSSKKRKVT